MIILLPLLAFAFVTLLATVGVMVLSPGAGAVVERRLGELAGKPMKAERYSAARAVDTLKRLGAAIPKSPSEMGKLRLRLVHAGFRRPDAVALFLGIRVGTALLAF